LITETETKARKIIRGARAIGEEMDEPNIQRVYYLLERGFVPGAYKEGGLWALSVPTYRRAIHGEAA
jgi:hypothetical protein